MSIVLTWGSEPTDLDSHLSYYVNNSQVCHVYYSNLYATYQGQTIAKLDLDDVTSYGPETVTITVNAALLKNKDHYSYIIHDYSNRMYSDSYELSNSGATIHVYAGNSWLNTYHVPKSNCGTVWHVFDIYADGLHTVNDFKNVSDPTQVG